MGRALPPSGEEPRRTAKQLLRAESRPSARHLTSMRNPASLN